MNIYETKCVRCGRTLYAKVGSDSPARCHPDCTPPPMRHTPGPWQVFTPQPECVGGPVGPMGGTSASQTTAGIAMCGMRLRTVEEQRANARLIAAAPTLKDLLETAVEYLESDDRESVRRLVADARHLLNLLPAEQRSEGGG